MRLVPTLLALSLLHALGACAHGRRPGSYLPVGASSQFGDRTQDGVVLMLSATESRVIAALERAMTGSGYSISDDAPRGVALQTTPRNVGGDTTLVIRAEVTPPDPSGGGAAVVLTGRYDVPSARIRNAQVIQRPGERSSLYSRLSALAASTRAELR